MYFPGVEAFLAIVQTKSLAKAAELLHLAPSTVSYRLKTLEDEMGIQLIERRKGISHIRLTATGESFINLAERWSTLWQETQFLQAAGSKLSLNISAPNSLNIYVLPTLYKALYQHAPPIRLFIHTEHTIESIASVVNRDMDVAFLVREVATPPTVALKPFLAEEIVLLRLATPERVATELVDPLSLQPEHELFMNWGTGYQAWHDKWWDPLYPRHVRVDIAGLIPAMMLDHRQWALVAKSVGEYYAPSGKFVIQRLSDPPPPRICFKLTHKYPSLSTLQSLLVLDKHLQALYMSTF